MLDAVLDPSPRRSGPAFSPADRRWSPGSGNRSPRSRLSALSWQARVACWPDAS